MYCITVSYGQVRGDAARYPYHQPALYEARARKSDGVVTWRYVKHLGRARRSQRLAWEGAKEHSAAYSVPLYRGIRHGAILKQYPPTDDLLNQHERVEYAKETAQA